MTHGRKQTSSNELFHVGKEITAVTCKCLHWKDLDTGYTAIHGRKNPWKEIRKKKKKMNLDEFVV